MKVSIFIQENDKLTSPHFFKPSYDVETEFEQLENDITASGYEAVFVMPLSTIEDIRAMKNVMFPPPPPPLSKNFQALHKEITEYKDSLSDEQHNSVGFSIHILLNMIENGNINIVDAKDGFLDIRNKVKEISNASEPIDNSGTTVLGTTIDTGNQTDDVKKETTSKTRKTIKKAVAEKTEGED